MTAIGPSLPTQDVRFHGEFWSVSGRVLDIAETTFMTHFHRRRTAFAVTHNTRNGTMRSLDSLPPLRPLELRQAA